MAAQQQPGKVIGGPENPQNLRKRLEMRVDDYFNSDLLECEMLIKRERVAQWPVGHADLQLDPG